MDTSAGSPEPTQTRRLHSAGLVLVGIVAGAAVTGLGVASAQTSAPSPRPSQSASPPGEAPREPRLHRHHFGRGMGFRGHVLHGEFTTEAPAGGYQRLATQVGEVTAVSASSVTVLSADNYSRTYVVDDNTLVNAGDDGIGDVKNGDDVRVVALVTDGTARAVQLSDITRIGNLRERWLPRPKLLRELPSQPQA